MTWHLRPMAPFDIESGGVNVENDGVVTITVGRVGDGPADMWSGLIAVDFDIDPKAIEVHHITTEYAREHGRPAAEVLDEAAERLAATHAAGIPTVGSNLAYDYTILDRNCTRYGVKTVSDRLGGQPIAPVLDVLVIDRRLDKYRPGKRKLENLCEQYGVKHGGAHDAVEDALAAARIAFKIGARSQLSTASLRSLYADRRYPDRLARDWQAFGWLALADVHTGQVGWYADQARGLGDYWSRTAEQKRAEASWDVPPGDEELSPDERRQVLLDEATELDTKVASLRFEWPIAAVAP
jgi:DNA polymerase-3 subunit epsilon